MSTEIQQFYFNGAALRTLTDKTGEPWFVAKDVCDILGHSNVSMALDRLDDDERSKFNLGRQGETNIVNEAGLYVLVLGSRKPEAHEFKRWVTHEVLPQIRRTGGYIHTTDTDSEEDILAKAVLVAQKTIEHKNRQIAEKDAQIKVLEPKALFADAVAASDGTCLVGELAKMLRQNGLNIGQNRLFQLLRDDGFFGKSGSNRNVPTQKAMDLGLFRIKETAVTHSDGHVTISRTPKAQARDSAISSPATARGSRMTDLLRPEEFAAMIGLSPRTLANWRSNGRGPKYLKLGPEPPAGKQDRRPVLYERDVAERWATAHQYTRTVAR